MADVFECHDKGKFEVTAISTGMDDRSALRQRLKNSFERFLDYRNLPDSEIAKEIRRLEIDILVDLNGLTATGRPGIFAARPAPVQVNFIGYPGTMGAPFIDYIIGDNTVFAPSHEDFYSEKLVRLPHNYFPNDSKRIIADNGNTRAEYGLPETGFVFCCFNNNHKILPDAFHRWMRILGRVPGSVLWLFDGHAKVVANLRAEAAKSGIDPDRLVFAKRIPLPEHLARSRHADLFLDTFPYNAHTMASDALWAGVPILTQIGETFVGRVAASFLNTIGLPELIASTGEEYENLAVELAVRPAALADIRAKIKRNRLTSPFFRTDLFTRHLETAFTMMRDRQQAGLAPDHIAVQDEKS